MLNFIRSHAASWVVKVLFVMLILSFAAWGIGDIFRLQRQAGPVITVGDVKIRREAVSQQFDRVIRSMQPLFNNRLDRDQARQIGLLDRAVDQLISEALLQQETQKLGIIATDDVVRHAIQTDPNFQGPDGKFVPRAEYGIRRYPLPPRNLDTAQGEPPVQRKCPDSPP